MFEVVSDDFGFMSDEKEVVNQQNGVRAINYNDISNCKIQLLKIYWSGVRLKLDYSYVLYKLIRVDDNLYRGTLIEQKKQPVGLKPKIRKVADNILIECLPDKGCLVLLSLQTEYEDGIFDPIYYDNTQKRFLCSNDLIGNNYNRYIAMYDDEAVFETEIRRIE